MRFSEVLLRLGCALVAWMVIYAYFVWLAALRSIGCGPDNDEMHLLLLGMAPFAVACAVMLRLTRPYREIHQILRWLSVPIALLFPLALQTTWKVFSTVNIGGGGICGDSRSTSWEAWWAPLQLAALAISAWLIVRVWRSVASDRSASANGA